MICNPCKGQRHENCVASGSDAPGQPPTGLSPDGDAIQRSGLCPCHHRATTGEDSKIGVISDISVQHIDQAGTLTTLVRFK
jgi:hypothetical protein